MIPASLKATLLRLIATGAPAVLIAAALIGHSEGTRYTPYRDVGGVLTVCEGHTGPDVIEGKTYTPGECATLRNRDIAAAEAAVDRLVKVPISTTERAALIDFAYNAGAGNLARSTLLRKLNAGDHAGACAEYRRWVNAGGQVRAGLVNRREAETWLCSINTP
ncbi:lysozyme [Candidimonas nitroreducens]|uniref:Lysozyme n=1 Tax=Candidimonas nitroreducens TaxID=683354 RepID=A0A225MLD0_9BURK|nr:lysozyme [Candidimonas nitroreducens]OWT62028.1 lysozyme [Candidimonas nitroreducens]